MNEKMNEKKKMTPEEYMKYIAEKLIHEKPAYLQKRYDFIAKKTGLSYYEIDNQKVVAIITNARFGLDERDIVSLYLDIHFKETIGTGAILNVDDAVGLIYDYAVRDVKDLVGLPIYMLPEAPGKRTYWVEPCKIKLYK